MPSHFTPAFFAFLRSLKRHNDRDWFAAHRDRYVADVEAPMLRFISDMGTRLPAISRAFVADPRRSGGSMHRIYRDTRFSHDKSPFKTWVAVHFRHRSAGKEQAAPGFYLHLGPGERFGGGGIYHPEMPALTRIRQHVVSSPKAWAAVLKSGVEIEGDSLKRAPAGFDPAHRFVVDLKRKDFYAGAEFTARQVTSSDFLDCFIDSCRDVSPLMKFLTDALGLRW
jgi:uncharacterized protein (TIGR02453 family)